jgi:hypothetical protein
MAEFSSRAQTKIKASSFDTRGRKSKEDAGDIRRTLPQFCPESSFLETFRKNMNIIRNILAVVIGFVIGGVVNMAVLAIGHAVMPPPAGFDGSSMEGVASTIHLLKPIDFIVPFLAHALGPLAGVLSAMFIAASGRKVIAIILGALFLLGGIIANVMIPAPAWYRVVDLVFAYVPMAFLGWKLSGKD